MMHDDFKINKSDLDEEWKQQAGLYFKYSEQFARAIKNRDDMKRKFNLKNSELVDDISSNPGDYDLSRVTDTVVKNKAIMQPEYQEALKNLDKAKLDENILEGAVWASQQKKSSLEYLTKLFLANYYAEDTHITDWQKTEITEKQTSQLSREGLEKSPMLSRRRQQIEEGGNHEK